MTCQEKLFLKFWLYGKSFVNLQSEVKPILQIMRYPIGIQTFERIIKDGYLYVDKTDLVWQLAHFASFVFMSRPRRFGKSLLTSTLYSYFSGDRELFEGLKIMELEEEWTQYPVLHFDLSGAKHIET